MELTLLLQTVLPGLGCLLLAGLAGRFGGDVAARRDTLVAAWVSALAFALGAIAISGWPGLPARSSSGWLVWLPLLALVPATAEGFRSRELPPGRLSILTWLLRLGLCLLGAWLLLGPRLSRLGAGETAAWLAGATVGWLALWAGLVGLALSLRPRETPGLPGGANPMVACGVLVGLVGFGLFAAASQARMAQLAGMLGGCVAGLGLLSLWSARRNLIFGLVPVLAVALGGLLTRALYAHKPIYPLLGIGLLPLLALLVLRLPWYPRLPWWGRTLLVVLILGLGAGGLIWWGYEPLPEDPYAGY